MNAMHRFIDDYEVILLDQGKTFMFENDRFGPGEDYYSTYRALGGTTLTPQSLRKLMDKLVSHMLELGRNPRDCDSFPSVPEVLRSRALFEGLSSEDFPLIDQLVSLHELGSISKCDADAIRSISNTHRLGIVSNIWGRKQPFEQNLADAGILDCFEHVVWSSEHGRIKPSPWLFSHALALFRVPAAKVLFVGDHPFRDILPAKNCGCFAAWLRNGSEVFPSSCPAPDLTITRVGDLLRAASSSHE